MKPPLLDAVVSQERPSHVFALFSGGHDSLTATAIAAQHPAFSAAVHINTGTGIPATTAFVRGTCEERGWPLIELHPDGLSYEDLVLRDGFPGGPKAHSTMFYWLKQRQIRRLVREYKRGPRDRIALVTGIRANESQRRFNTAMAVPVFRQGAQVYVNPILHWSARDCRDFMDAEGLRRNRVVDLLHRSGECLCGALADASEIRDLELWFPDVAASIHALEARAEAAGHLECVWAGRDGSKVSRSQQRLFPILPLCWSCEAAS